MEETGMTIQLANKEYIYHLGMIRDVGVLIGKIIYPGDFIVLGCSQDLFCPRIDLPKERVYIKCVGKNFHLTSLNSLITYGYRTAC
jgi:hypothetical protein